MNHSSATADGSHRIQILKTEMLKTEEREGLLRRVNSDLF